SPANGVPPKIMNSTRFFPYFKDCVGAIDCSHIPAMISIKEQAKWRIRKGFISQNVLASYSFDLTFQYVLTGWEGSASDSRILADALN
ncbi:uncharacterized protein LOC131226960, partial [Magnolia sinica]|uniref:uncharacterized protein LOC131226960 n=1 Tax=Magnolia sinica TaxID=86752 RepID=UPI0026589186